MLSHQKHVLVYKHLAVLFVFSWNILWAVFWEVRYIQKTYKCKFLPQKQDFKRTFTSYNALLVCETSCHLRVRLIVSGTNEASPYICICGCLDDSMKQWLVQPCEQVTPQATSISTLMARWLHKAIIIWVFYKLWSHTKKKKKQIQSSETKTSVNTSYMETAIRSLAKYCHLPLSPFYLFWLFTFRFEEPLRCEAVRVRSLGRLFSLSPQSFSYILTGWASPTQADWGGVKLKFTIA